MNALEGSRNARVEAWLRTGVVLTSTERLARLVLQAFHETRQAAGLEAWTTPAVYSWDAWVRERWLERNSEGLMLLNPLQEHSLWVKVIRRSQSGGALLHVDRLATAAQQASRLLSDFAPSMLSTSIRSGWPGDAAVFSEWLTGFEAFCRREGFISAGRLADRLTQALKIEPGDQEAARLPLLLLGFDRLLKSQVALLDSWGSWQEEGAAGSGGSTESRTENGREDLPKSARHFFAAPDLASELTACTRWLRQRLDANPAARLLVVSPELQQLRGSLERTLLQVDGGLPTGPRENEIGFEFSQGVPLATVSVARSALLLMRWLVEPLAEAEVDWLLSSGQCVASLSEEIQLAETMRQIRRNGLERTAWSLGEFLRVASGRKSSRGKPPANSLPDAWVARLVKAKEQLLQTAEKQSPLDWVRLTQSVLETAGWPGFHTESSVVFQGRERWQTMLETCGSLGFDGTEMSWAEFVSTVAQAASTTIFAVESTDAPVQITEPLESSGQFVDGIWFLGAAEEQWPARGTPHSLLPAGLQREFDMPHSSTAADWKLAQGVTERLLASAEEVIFSYARQSGEVEARPSRLVLQAVRSRSGATDAVEEMPHEWMAEDVGGLKRGSKTSEPLSECFDDFSRVGFEGIGISGGAGTLTNQSLCPFKAFATSRLVEQHWEPAQDGLNAKQRGVLLHGVLNRVWSRERGGIENLDQLQHISDLNAFVRPLVQAEIDSRSGRPGAEFATSSNAHQESRESFTERFPKRFLDLEVVRLTRLVAEWLTYELKRWPFRVLATETQSDVVVAGLTLHVRLDRVDELPDGSRLIIDYKSSDVGPSAWSGERPDDVQLPLYATFAVEEAPEGLLFGRIRPAKPEFCGRTFSAKTKLIPSLIGSNGLVKEPLTLEQLDAWREMIEQLGRDYVSGLAEVDPKRGMETCQRCHLQAVCRIAENQPAEDDREEGADSESFAEVEDV